MSMSAFVEVTQSPVAEFGECRLVWEYRADRWQHCIQIRKRTTPHREWGNFLLSVDPTLEIGPVFQDLLREEREGGCVEFQAMGQSGGVIHSASIRCQPESQEVIFELATRFKTVNQLQPLVAVYQMSGEGLGLSPLPRIETLSATGNESQVPRIHQSSQGEWQIRWHPEHESAGEMKRSGSGVTVCWGYRLSWPDGLGS